MPDLNITVSDFSGVYGTLNARNQLDVTKEQALHAAITVGTPLLTSGTASARHALTMATYKAVAVKASIDFSGTNLSIFDDYRRLDPSEKVNLSYWIGMVFTALLAKELLGVKQLLHAACFEQQPIVRTNPLSKSLADLVGRESNGGWHVLEAKGRQNKLSPSGRVDCKNQAKTIGLIGGHTPLTRSYCVALVKRTLSVELVDPEGEKGTYDIVFQRSGEDPELLEAYYGSLRDVLAQSSFDVLRGELSFILTRIAFDAVDQRHVFVGMESNCYNGIKGNKLPDGIRPVKGSDFYLGADGIVTLTSAKCDPTSD